MESMIVMINLFGAVGLLLFGLAQVTGHIVSVAHPIMDESSLLIESRLRDVG